MRGRKDKVKDKGTVVNGFEGFGAFVASLRQNDKRGLHACALLHAQ
jgi:hypothetical protein